jgi:hypothetical protein
MSLPKSTTVFRSCHRSDVDPQRARELWSELSSSYPDLEVAVPINDESGWCVLIVVWDRQEDAREYVERGLAEEDPDWRSVINLLPH